MIKLKQYSPATAISLEQEISQLESVMVALEAAQTNPEISTLLYGPSVGLESFGNKVKDTIKKLWEALMAFVKKLFGWGKKTEERAEEVVADIKKASPNKVNITEEQKKQHEAVIKLLSNVPTLEEAMSKLEENQTIYDQLPKAKLKQFVKGHYRYYGHYLFDRNLGMMFPDLSDAMDKYIVDRDRSKATDTIFDILEHALKGTIPSGKVNLLEQINRLAEETKKYDTSKHPFTTGKSGMLIELSQLKSDFENQIKVANSWNDCLDNFNSNLRYAESEKERMAEEIATFRMAFSIAKILTEYMNKNIDYLRAVLEYRKHFEE